jgi:cell division protein FtsW (lipid II flippase)
MIRILARLIVSLIGWVAPRSAHEWAQAMQTEIAAITSDRTNSLAALRFALGCLWAAVIFRLRSAADEPARVPSSSVMSARLLFVQVNCGCGAATIGLLYLIVAKAPLALVVVNTVALLLGVLLVGASPRLRGLSSRFVSGASIAIAAALLLTAVSGHAVDGVSRWVQVGPLFVQTSLVFLPVAALLYAHTVNRWTTMAMIAIAIAVALQPDRAMAVALCAGLLALLLVRRTRAVAIACSAAAVAVLVTCLQADRLPAVPFVDHILWSSFRLHPLLGVALWLGSAMLFVPMLVIRSDGARAVLVACGACWAAIVVAAAVGAYPTPVVGYGGAAILGYFLCLAALGAQTTEQTMETHAPAQSTASSPDLQARESENDSDHSRARVHRGALVVANASL